MLVYEIATVACIISFCCGLFLQCRLYNAAGDRKAALQAARMFVELVDDDPAVMEAAQHA